MRSRALVVLFLGGISFGALACASSTSKCADLDAPRTGPATSVDPGPAVAVQSMFDAMRRHEVERLRKLVLPGAQIVRAMVGTDGELESAFVSDADFVQGTAGSEPTIDERWIGEPEVRVEGALASVWGAYEVWVDGEYQHCGVDAIHLVRAKGAWQVASVTYTATQKGCVPHSPD